MRRIHTGGLFLGICALGLFAAGVSRAFAPPSPSPRQPGGESPDAEAPSDTDADAPADETSADDADRGDASPERTQPTRRPGDQDSQPGRAGRRTQRAEQRVPRRAAEGDQPGQTDRDRRRTETDQDRRTTSEDQGQPSRRRQPSRQTDERGEDQETDLEEDLSLRTDDNNQLTISEIERDSVFARAGIREEDVIVSVNGRRVVDREGFFRLLRQNRGQPLALVVLRDGQSRTIRLNLAQRGQRAEIREQGGTSQAALGVVLDMRYGQEAVVERVYRDSPADHAGIRSGDVIVSFDGRDVYSPQHLMNLIASRQPGDEVDIEYTRRVTRSSDVELGSRDVLSDGAMPLTQERQEGDEDSSEAGDRHR